MITIYRRSLIKIAVETAAFSDPLYASMWAGHPANPNPMTEAERFARDQARLADQWARKERIANMQRGTKGFSKPLSVLENTNVAKWGGELQIKTPIIPLAPGPVGIKNINRNLNAAPTVTNTAQAAETVAPTAAVEAPQAAVTGEAAATKAVAPSVEAAAKKGLAETAEKGVVAATERAAAPAAEHAAAGMLGRLGTKGTLGLLGAGLLGGGLLLRGARQAAKQRALMAAAGAGAAGLGAGALLSRKS